MQLWQKSVERFPARREGRSAQARHIPSKLLESISLIMCVVGDAAVSVRHVDQNTLQFPINRNL